MVFLLEGDNTYMISVIEEGRLEVIEKECNKEIGELYNIIIDFSNNKPYVIVMTGSFYSHLLTCLNSHLLPI